MCSFRGGPLRALSALYYAPCRALRALCGSLYTCKPYVKEHCNSIVTGSSLLLFNHFKITNSKVGVLFILKLLETLVI